MLWSSRSRTWTLSLLPSTRTPTANITETGGASYRCLGRRALTADESWPASVFAAAVPASLDPEDPVEGGAVLPEGGASLYFAGLMLEGSLAGGVQAGHWSQADL